MKIHFLDEETKLQGKEPFPGMPAEVLIRGESRRVIAYRGGDS